MKKSIILLTILSLFSFVNYAQENQTAVADSILFEKLEHDYGTIERGSDGNSVFTFTNQGEKPLVLSNVRASCGCTVPQWPRTPIAPGEHGEIKVKYNTNIVGAFNKTITVNSNAANSMVRLRVKGQVVANQ
ncbi:MAG: DUF1573 domain-containing protein [Bacteroidales bacterium]|nr:DUF1573 domain-containing protein [Bacteroidales bacterium]